MLSPFQEVPPSVPRPADPLCGTYETTEAYQAFLKEEAEAASVPAAPLPLDRQMEVMMEQERLLNPWKYSAELGKQTPLLEFLRAGGGQLIAAPTKKEPKKKKEKKKAANDAAVPGTNEPKDRPKAKPKAKQRTQQTPLPALAEQQPKQTVPLKIMSRPKTEGNPTATSTVTKPPAAATSVPSPNTANPPKVFTTSKKTQQPNMRAKPPQQQQQKDRENPKEAKE